ncbi:chromosomal replication initiator protein DnaA [Chloroflexota bacterium]
MKKRTARDIWESALQQLEQKVTAANYQTWLQNTVGLSYKKNQFTVGVPNNLANEWVGKRLHSLIKQILTGVAGQDLEVNFQVCPNGEVPDLSPLHPPDERISPPKFNPKYVFPSFVVGSCNRLAHAAAMGVAEKPGCSYNPLFIYSGVGLGKSHLLHAIGWVVLRNSPNVIYVTAEQFTNEFITSIRERNTEDFRNKYRSASVLLIDDVQFIAGKEQTQEGFFHTFNDLHNSNRQIVITSDRPPKSLSLLEDRLRSRFEWGLTVDMQPPDLETRIAILQMKAEEHKKRVPPEVLDLIARRSQRNVRELEGTLNRVIAYSQLTREPLTLEVSTQALAEIASDGPRHNLTIPSILNAVASFFDLDLGTIKGKKRDKPLVQARQMAMYILREELQCSWMEIGRELGGRDHSTIIHGYEKMSSDINTDPSLRRALYDIRESLYLKP